MTITKVKHARALTGGGTGALDAYSVATLNLGVYIYKAMVFSGGKFYYYEYDPAGTAAENSPLIIRPDDYATAGNWVLAGSPYGDIQVQPEIVSGLPIEGGISGGDISIVGNTLTITPTSCLNSTLSTKLFTTINKTCVIPTVANTIYHIFLVKLVADGSCEFRAYSTEAAVTSDAQVSNSRYRGWCKTGVTGAVLNCKMVGNVLSFLEPYTLGTLPASGTVSFAALVPSSRCMEYTLGFQSPVPGYMFCYTNVNSMLLGGGGSGNAAEVQTLETTVRGSGDVSAVPLYLHRVTVRC